MVFVCYLFAFSRVCFVTSWDVCYDEKIKKEIAFFCFSGQDKNSHNRFFLDTVRGEQAAMRLAGC